MSDTVEGHLIAVDVTTGASASSRSTSPRRDDGRRNTALLRNLYSYSSQNTSKEFLRKKLHELYAQLSSQTDDEVHGLAPGASVIVAKSKR
jgi:hypothetical protein